MAGLEHLVSNSKMSGVWLLDDVALDEIDALIEEAWNQLIARKKDLVDREVKKRRSAAKRQGDYNDLSSDERKQWNSRVRADVQGSYRLSPERREVTVVCKTGKKVSKQSFSQLRADSDLKRESVTEFEIVLKAADQRIEMDLDESWGTSMRFSRSPESSELVKEYVAKFEFWADRQNARWWQRTWRKFAGFHWVLFLVLLWIAATIGTVIEKANREDKWTAEAHELLHNGISDEEERAAIEILLALESKYPSETAGGGSNKAERTLLVVLCVGIVLCIVRSFPPKTAIGIGKGVHAVQRQRIWLKAITAIIPAFLIMGVLASAAGSAVFEFLRSAFSQ